MTRQEPGIYVIEDAHWIDEVSESMLADFLAVVPQTHSVVLITYRPEYGGALARVSGAQTIALRPLSDTQAAELIAELLGLHPSVQGLAELTAERAAGNPFFAEEIVRDLAERGVIRVSEARTRRVATWGNSACHLPCRPLSPLASTDSTKPPNGH